MMPRGWRVLARGLARATFACLLCAAAPASPRAAGAPPVESAPVRRVGSAACLSANDLARLLDATKFWRSDLRKLVLRAGAHRLTFTVDDAFAVVDDRTVWLREPVRSSRGELQIPLTVLGLLPGDSTLARLVHEPRRGLVVRVPRGGLVRGPDVTISDTLTRVQFAVERVADVSVTGRARAHFRVRFAGTYVGSPPESLPPASMVRGIRQIAAATGSAFELTIVPGAPGFRLVREPGVVALEFPRARLARLDEFALEERPGRVRTIVIDPGHGGAETGITVGGRAEKDIALALARLVRQELTRRLSAEVLLTREDDRLLTPEQRAEVANRARADLVLSLHFDAVPGTPRSGATAWCPPAGVGSRGGAGRSHEPLALLPWREVAMRHAVQSRAVAEAVLEAIDLAGGGPVRLRERLMRPLLGVNAPGVMLDCATLSSSSDWARVEDPRGLQALAAAIAEGVARWARGG